MSKSFTNRVDLTVIESWIADCAMCTLPSVSNTLKQMKPSTDSECIVKPSDSINFQGLDYIPTTQAVDFLSRQISDSDFIQEGICNSGKSGVNSCAVAAGIDFDWSTMFTNLCVCDPKLLGQPIRLQSSEFGPPVRALKIGSCHFMNLPFDLARDECGLNVNRGSDGRPTFLLEHAASLIDLDTNKISSIVVAQTNITQMIRGVAVCEIIKEQIEESAPNRQKAQKCVLNKKQEQASANSFVARVRKARPKATKYATSHSNKPFVFYTDIDPIIPDADWDRLFSTPAEEEREAAVTGKPLPRGDKPPPISIPILQDLLNTLNYLTELHRYIFILSASNDSATNTAHDIPSYHREQKAYKVTHVSISMIPSSQSSKPKSAPKLLSYPLSHTPQGILKSVAEKLSHGRSFVTEGVRWGSERKVSRLYCTPVSRGGSFGKNHITTRGTGLGDCWVCVLVAPSMKGL